MGPNEGKSFLEQTKCVARALMSYSGSKFYDQNSLAQKMIEYISQHGSIEKKWFKHKYSWGDWYVYYDSLESGGRSCGKLPDGIEVAATLDFRSSERIFKDKFEKAVSDLESGCVTNSFSDNQKHEIQNLKKTVEACRSDFNNNKIVEFRNWICKFPYIKPDHLIAFSKHLAEERSKYCADAHLYGSIATITDICKYCASKAQNKVKDNYPIEYYMVFRDQAWILTTSTETNPVIILAGTVQKAIDCGFVDELLKIISNYREKADGKIEAAREAETTDKSLEELYEAIGYAHGAHIILANLRRNAEHLGTDRAKMVEASYSMVDEDLVRMQQPFKYQIMDFNGERWKEWRREIAEAKRSKDPESSKKLINFIIEQNLNYPRRFIPALLSENETLGNNKK